MLLLIKYTLLYGIVLMLVISLWNMPKTAAPDAAAAK